MYIGTAVDGVNDRRQTLSPGEGALLVGYQVLADLDQRVSVAVDDGMPEHGVATQRAVIGFIVADHEVFVRDQHIDQRPRHPVVHIPQDTDMPGTLPAFYV